MLSRMPETHNLPDDKEALRAMVVALQAQSDALQSNFKHKVLPSVPVSVFGNCRSDFKQTLSVAYSGEADHLFRPMVITAQS